jgi:hypothetical protein
MIDRCLRRRLGVAVTLLWLAALPAAAQEAGEDAGSKLPLGKVVLFNSGVGYYEHLAEIEGNTEVELKFNVDDVNDLLKSMVLQDLGGGKISSVNYASKDPITRTLRTFAIDLTENPTLADLLNQVRGERVAVDAPTAIEGVILGIERRNQQVKDQVVQVEVLNLLTDDGLRSIPLETVSRIRLVNADLDAELRQALAVLALGHATDKKSVRLSFLGEGVRTVRVGYIQESPIWKTSYRLVLNDDEQPFLQGWAIVENTTEVDWRDVSLTLVSGRPISFVMNLYDPLYVARPVVEPELFASLRPQTYGQDLAAAGREFEELAEGEARKQRADQDRANRGRGEALARAAAAPEEKAADANGRFDLQQGVQSVAQAGDVGELFQYEIDTPVTLPRQQSAMLAIVNGNVEGQKVGIYNASVHAKHPLDGLRLKNTSGLHLMQGPVTVFDGGAYAGDAQIEDLPPGTERLISYALDLDTEVAPESRSQPTQLVSVKLSKGVLQTTHRYGREQDYTVKNSGRRTKTVLIEYPLDANWKLLTPEKATEQTRDRYRFAVEAEPGQPAKLEIREEQVVSQQVALTNLDDNSIVYYLSVPQASEKIKQALRETIARRQRISQIVAERQQLEAQIATIDQEQARIRENMAQLERNSDLYNRYVKKFGEQEDLIEGIRKQIAELIESETQERKALDEYLLGLELE